jgi:hypothetical protein
MQENWPFLAQKIILKISHSSRLKHSNIRKMRQILRVIRQVVSLSTLLSSSQPIFMDILHAVRLGVSCIS